MRRVELLVVLVQRLHRAAVALGVNRRYPLEDDGLCVLQHLLDRGITGEDAAQSILAQRDHS